MRKVDCIDSTEWNISTNYQFVLWHQLSYDYDYRTKILTLSLAFAVADDENVDKQDDDEEDYNSYGDAYDCANSQSTVFGCQEKTACH